MIDKFGRAVTYLRVSVTDRCDLRCSYWAGNAMRLTGSGSRLSPPTLRSQIIHSGLAVRSTSASRFYYRLMAMRPGPLPLLHEAFFSQRRRLFSFLKAKLVDIGEDCPQMAAYTICRGHSIAANDGIGNEIVLSENFLHPAFVLHR